MQLISWNVNGIRAALKKGFEETITQINADIICLQETKISEDLIADFDIARREYPYQYWNCAEKKGYAGTAMLSRIKPETVESGIGDKINDREGRLQIARFSGFYLVNVYTPNSQAGLVRLDYRHKSWDVEFRKLLERLDEELPVIFCGDLNVAHEEIDIARPKQNRRNAGFTDEEREGFTLLLKAGFKDTFREFHPGEEGHYSWWSYRGRAREKNVGWRLDYFGVSDRLFPNVKEARILKDVPGSDHVPVSLLLRDTNKA